MIKISNVEIRGFGPAIRGMRNPKNSWERSDSHDYGLGFDMGDEDTKLAKKLADAGPVHGKFLRMIVVWVDVEAPLYWWKEEETYKVGTVVNSCSTMHTIHKRDLTIDDFSTEHMSGRAEAALLQTIESINMDRAMFLKTNDKEYWHGMIQSLPTCFNQKRTLMLNYEVLRNMYTYRKEHKLDEWREFCKWIKTLPYSWLIIGGGENNDEATAPEQA